MAASRPRTEHALASLRAEIDAIDAALVDLLARRLGVVRRVIEVKRAEDIAALLPERVEEVVARVRDAAGARSLPPELAERLWRELIDWTIEYENAELRRTSHGEA